MSDVTLCHSQTVRAVTTVTLCHSQTIIAVSDVTLCHSQTVRAVTSVTLWHSQTVRAVSDVRMCHSQTVRAVTTGTVRSELLYKSRCIFNLVHFFSLNYSVFLTFEEIKHYKLQLFVVFYMIFVHSNENTLICRDLLRFKFSGFLAKNCSAWTLIL